ncbi:MAG: replication protein [Mesorhizobium sp.]|uniref:replication initiator protein A n=5 Tax=Mesorhizobium TaxID=68287 RepID=UPI000FCC7C7B|nr:MULTISPECIES: replication initiator protein A [unclassified Mesorhizobium]RUV74853.1 replication protein [Mesorhizobium sp. M5C.F.Cr.IN.023.01.1.1]RWI41292.1 MAG: replication protein [Mesorhizobium sp.]RWI49717.1 MAG: replication protein [Mesorhizobium sp.]RWI53138.1 MAG: replication protein [Mesorhizobium sp.]RWI70107.1 MAG: replication protein [Mesorhizobium sp.]
MTARRHAPSERGQLDLFRALPGSFAPRDAQDLMAYPFFSLSKTHRVAPIDFCAGDISIRVEAVPDHGMATIWDADILIWAASQIVEARDARLRTSRLMAATPYEILTFVGRGTSLRDYQRLKAALDRLQSTTVCTSIRQPAEGRRHRFSWINEWQERTDRQGRPAGIELIVPDWFYQAVLDDALVLTIDRTYFDLTGGIDRWLYRLVRKHGGRQQDGWRFDFRHLHQKSGSLSPFKRFAFELRDIIRRQPLPGYTLSLEVEIGGRVLLAFEPACGQFVEGLVLSGTRAHVLSGTGGSCYREPKRPSSPRKSTENRSLNLDSNRESNLKRRARDVNNIQSGHRNRPEAPADRAIPDTTFRNSASTTDDTSDAPNLPLGRKPGGAR